MTLTFSHLCLILQYVWLSETLNVTDPQRNKKSRRGQILFPQLYIYIYYSVGLKKVSLKHKCLFCFLTSLSKISFFFHLQLKQLLNLFCKQAVSDTHALFIGTGSLNCLQSSLSYFSVKANNHPPFYTLHLFSSTLVGI